MCDYAEEYGQWAPEWEVAVTLHRLCTEGRGLVEARVHCAAAQKDKKAAE